jgi:hypothetical protein
LGEEKATDRGVGVHGKSMVHHTQCITSRALYRHENRLDSRAPACISLSTLEQSHMNMFRVVQRPFILERLHEGYYMR